MNDTAPGLGHNRPSIPAPEAIQELLAEENADIVKRALELAEAFGRCPAAIEDDATQGKVADFVKQVTACEKLTKSRFETAKAPALAAGKAVDGFFARIRTPLATIKEKLGDRLTLYGRAKADAERRAREERERIAREEAERQRKEAAEREAAMQNEADLSAAVSSAELARQAEADAETARKAAAAKPAELSRTRGDLGSVASLRTFWDFKDLSRERLDLSALRPYIPQAALEQAVRGAIKAGVRQVGGVVIYENSRTQVA